MEHQHHWKYTCPKCGKISDCTTNISQRSIDDKYTDKELNTAASCAHCGEVTIIEDLEEVFNIEFAWKNPMAEKPAE